MAGFPKFPKNLLDPSTQKALAVAQEQWFALKKAGVFEAQILVPELRAIPNLKLLPEIPRVFEQWSFIADSFAQTDQFLAGLSDVLVPSLHNLVSLPQVEFPRVELPRIDLSPLADVGNLLSNLPDIWELASLSEEVWEAMEEAGAGGAALEAADYGFADHLWDVVFLKAFANVNPKVAHAVITRKLAAATSKEGFRELLLTELEGSKVLSKRVSVVEKALDAHAKKDYELSVPALLPQIEGSVVDAMFLKDLVVKKNGKIYLADENGEPRRSEKTGKLLMPVTLHPAITNVRLGEDDLDLAAASEFVADTLVPRRNAILHGRDVRYARAKLSVQALLVLLVMARGVRDLEPY